MNNVQVVPNQDAPLALKWEPSNELLNAVLVTKGCHQKMVHQASIRHQIAKHVTINNLLLTTLLAACKAPVTAEILESRVLKPWKYLPKGEKAKERLAGRKTQLQEKYYQGKTTPTKVKALSKGNAILWVKIYLNRYAVYAMLDSRSAANLIYPEVACATGISVSTALHPLVRV